MGDKSMSTGRSFTSSEFILAYTPFEELSNLNGYIYSEEGILVRARDIIYSNATNLSYLNEGREWVYFGDIVKTRDIISPLENEGWIISIFSSRLKNLQKIISSLSLPFDSNKVYTSCSREDKKNFILTD